MPASSRVQTNQLQTMFQPAATEQAKARKKDAEKQMVSRVS